MTATAFDHVNLRIPRERLAAVRDFYVQVVGLREGERPPSPTAGHWLYLGDHPVLHLMDASFRQLDAAVLAGGRGPVDHLAFACRDLEGTLARLARLGVPYRRRDVPEAGFTQLFVEDPQGLSVELNFRAGGG
ncbi:MAG: hypothetical protein KatS3mg124_0376 [Porticoccaceae bacterium]|nr:MAG: hypothetical protein KatS3mg124_0376 [Porticoccaceae bacterium]